MPLRSKAQQRWMFWAEKEGKLPKGTAKEWAEETPNIKKLPERVKKASGKENPDIPPYEDDKSGWTQGSQLEGAFQKVSFTEGFKKTAAPVQSMAGTMDAAIKKHNTQLIERMRTKKPMFSLKDIAKLYPGLRMMKTAEPSMSMEANNQSGWSIGDYMPGTELRNNAETGQFKGKNYRTEGVQNESKEFKKSLKQHAQTARGGKHYGGTIANGIAENRNDQPDRS